MNKNQTATTETVFNEGIEEGEIRGTDYWLASDWLICTVLGYDFRYILWEIWTRKLTVTKGDHNNLYGENLIEGH